MSATRTFTCDGCGKVVQMEGRLYPGGWLNLPVWGRALGAPHKTLLNKVDICHPLCAPAALASDGIEVGATPPVVAVP